MFCGYAGSMLPPSPVELLHQALKSHAQDKDLLRRIGNGYLHEYQLLASLWHACRQAGVDAHMLDIVRSNHPLDERDNLNKPQGYWIQRQGFLEVEGHLLGVSLEYKPHTLLPLMTTCSYSSRQEVIDSWSEAVEFKWECVDEDCKSEGLQELITPSLIRELQAAKLGQSTPSSNRKKTLRRV